MFRGNPGELAKEQASISPPSFLCRRWNIATSQRGCGPSLQLKVTLCKMKMPSTGTLHQLCHVKGLQLGDSDPTQTWPSHCGQSLSLISVSNTYHDFHTGSQRTKKLCFCIIFIFPFFVFLGQGLHSFKNRFCLISVVLLVVGFLVWVLGFVWFFFFFWLFFP